ncbi:phenylalanine--tRNA ligase subunit beta [Gammaproteobacteria bacterium]|nr:phenylalanine--tRNA ligase subunit beta [Gammaproteobacteria bacterium]
MKIPFKDIIRGLEESPSIDEVSKKLFQLGHEHEIIDNIFDFEFTPNRGDCLSLVGLLRELSIFYKLNNDLSFFEGEIDNLELDFINNATDICPQISFLYIEIDEEISEFKDYINSYFKDLNLNKNNFFTDISNYLAYEMGQPTHCYDFEKINGQIIFENFQGESDFITLLDSKIKIKDANPVFKINNEIINLAGVIGGKTTACSKNTRSVLVECAYFKPETIIGKALKYNIQSDAAYKFERGVDYNNHDNILRRFISIVMNHTNIKSMKVFSKKYETIKRASLPIDVGIINKILGINISESEYLTQLNDLGFVITNEIIKTPSYRHDIFSQNDLAEEIARVIGYDNIDKKNINISNTETDKEFNKIENKLRDLLIDNGFYEVINFPFVDESSKESVLIDNPIDSNKKYLRLNMKQSLTQNLLFNERRQKDSVKLFEISNIYSNKTTIEQQKKIAIIGSGRIGKNFNDFSKKINKNYLEELLTEIVPKNNFNVEQIDRKNLDTKSKNEIVYSEINLNDFTEKILEKNSFANRPKDYIQYTEISEFPSSTRDLSFSVTEYSNLAFLENKILSYQNKLIKEVFIFDYYKNDKNNEIKVGFRFVFQSYKKTITDSEVDKVLNDIIKLSLSINGIKLPGF